MASSHGDNAALGLLVSSVTEKFGTLSNHPDGTLNVLREVRLLYQLRKIIVDELILEIIYVAAQIHLRLEVPRSSRGGHGDHSNM